MSITQMTLDQAQDRFETNRSSANALRYLLLALEYWLDDMVGDATLAFTLGETKALVSKLINGAQHDTHN